MAIDKTLAAKSRQHTVYKTADGTRVPGVTTVLSVLAKPALINWANKMGLQGIDTTKYVDAAAQAGTAAHAMIEAHLKGEEFDPSPYPADLLSLAENGYIKYLDWEGSHQLNLIGSEMPLVSEAERYGGCIDCYAELDGIPTLIDFKTNSSGVYDEMRHQVVAYKNLLLEHGYAVQKILIVRLGKSDQMDLEAVEVGNWETHERIFRACLDLYRLQGELKRIAA